MAFPGQIGLFIVCLAQSLLAWRHSTHAQMKPSGEIFGSAANTTDEQGSQANSSLLDAGVQAKQGEKCGWLRDRGHACYPRNYEGMLSKKYNKTACSSQCTLSGPSTMSKVASYVFESDHLLSRSCKCPNKDEHCTSVQDKPPGLKSTRANGITYTGPVKVDIATGKWQFLTSETKEDGPNDVEEWKWVFPDSSENSYMDHNEIDHLKPITVMSAYCASEISEGESFDFCDEKVAKKYFLKLETGKLICCEGAEVNGVRGPKVPC